ncbi:MAG: hypothetical protein LBN95_03470 [Prevotellaceae bacterium]|jgi:hypothetical protein|nr:hypothetical protein [Prevotellaceae bacterium]
MSKKMLEKARDKINFIIKHNSEYETDGNKFVNWTESFIGDSLDCDKRYQIVKNYKENKIVVIFEEQFDSTNVPFDEKLFYLQCCENDILWSVEIIIE